MGGWGSGRRWASKNTTGDYRQLDVRRLQQSEVLERRYAFNWQWTRNGEQTGFITIRPEDDRLNLMYRSRSAGEDWVDYEYPVLLERTPCRYGGERVWFRCPARGCGRRVAILYGGAIFACRRCRDLAYPSQREPQHDRLLGRAQSLHVRLGGSGAVGDGLPLKPKGMHWRTYERLSRQYLRFESAMDFAAAAHFGF
jgi:hypothetical protein